MKIIEITLKAFKALKKEDYNKYVEYLIKGKRRTAKIFFHEKEFNITVFNNSGFPYFNKSDFRKSVTAAHNYAEKNM